MEHTYDNVETEIVEALKKIETDNWRERPDGRWTREIKNRMSALAKSHNASAWASGCDEAKGEWLYDMTWLDYAKSNYLLSAPLVLESEWGSRGEIDDDFQKLLLARADHRVMIFGAANEQSGIHVVKDLEKQVNIFTRSEEGDRYLFAYWCAKEAKFAFALYVK